MDRAPSNARRSLGDRILEKPVLTIAIIVCVPLFFGLLAVFIVTNTFAIDFGVYWRTANDHTALAYAPRSTLPFPYAPTMLLWIAPLSLVPMWAAYFLWVALSAGMIVFACRRYLKPAETALVIFSPPLVNGFAAGQVSVALAALLLWAAGASNRVLAGVAFGVIASIKPQLVIMAPLFLLATKDWQALVAAGLSFISLVAASIFIFGIGIWGQWAGSMSNFHHVVLNQRVLNVTVTPASAAQHWNLPPLPFLIIGIVVGAWLVVRSKNLDPLGKSAAIGCGSLLAAPYAVTYDLAPLIPFLVWSVFRGKLTAVFALSGAFHPLPLVFTAVNLCRESRWNKH